MVNGKDQIDNQWGQNRLKIFSLKQACLSVSNRIYFNH